MLILACWILQDNNTCSISFLLEKLPVLIDIKGEAIFIPMEEIISFLNETFRKPNCIQNQTINYPIRVNLLF